MSVDVTTILLCLFYTLQNKLSAMSLIRLKIYQGKCPCCPYGSYASAVGRSNRHVANLITICSWGFRMHLSSSSRHLCGFRMHSAS